MGIAYINYAETAHQATQYSAFSLSSDEHWQPARGNAVSKAVLPNGQAHLSSTPILR